jgi:hypothetical protein
MIYTNSGTKRQKPANESDEEWNSGSTMRGNLKFNKYKTFFSHIKSNLIFR